MWYKFAEQFIEEEYPHYKTGDFDIADGDIPNMNSISASLDNYEILPGIRQIPLSDFNSSPRDLFYAANDHKRTRELAEQIR